MAQRPREDYKAHSKQAVPPGPQGEVSTSDGDLGAPPGTNRNSRGAGMGRIMDVPVILDGCAGSGTGPVKLQLQTQRIRTVNNSDRVAVSPLRNWWGRGGTGG